jgi:O-antigen biosynthesis protein
MENGYYRNPRPDLLRRIPPGTKRVLEIGSAAGETGKALKEMGTEEVVGVEIVEEVARQGEGNYDRLFIGDAEKINLPYEDGHFDCVLYGDVLEHLVDPWRMLREHAKLLKSGGTMLCSIPNIRHYRILKMLALRGEWTYKDGGIMDRTHLRFFTLKSIRSLLDEAGFEIRSIDKKPSGPGWMKVLNRLLGNGLIDYLVRQFIVIAVKREEARR